MRLRDELLEFLRDRWTRVTTRILVPALILFSIYSVIISRLDILWLGIYAFILILLLLDSLYILLAKEKMPAIEVAGRGSKAQAVAKYSLLKPYAGIVMLSAL